MEKITIWHNPRCGKSRDALTYLEDKKFDINIVKYLDETPSKEEIKNTLKLLGLSAKELMRTKEDIYKELNLKDETSEDRLIEAMVKNPKLIERPVVIKGKKAVIARPLENIDKIL
ncbi:arsenate reductase (glutaredoxin) [Halarcobacter ebronensis]|uniref:Arsenate reductase (Glutaredoxin) n=1 Tax=Halarcobacter ebronensis TaxID=1462615 RepID=A0A4Q1ANJ2_9BACT|nr:arsenate reductase (glutaredoxin) [Halarcobacter ebronensis]QKF82264.1 arsenate reductase (ArsC) family protein [Halarcobacter ebronensis]RXK07703.1 arsenate reductase (glutaredoxin) [Halarcobacter ebronensis]